MKQRWALLVLTAALIAPPFAFAGTEIMPVKDIRPGMKGYGLTVFQGTKPEKFEFEVIGILPNYKPHYDVILVRNSHPTLAHTGNFHGMSGSPMYIDGKLIGAFALGFQTFPKDLIGGVTSIEAMIADGSRAANPTVNEPPLPLESPAKGKSSDLPSLRPLKLACSVSGFNPRSLALINDCFGKELGNVEFRAGGASSASYEAKVSNADLQPGDAFEVQFMRGDMTIEGGGTVTQREGNRILGFGHYLFMWGDIEIPIVTSRVLAIPASLEDTSRMSIGVQEIGVLTTDRRSCVAGELGRKAPMTPISIRTRNTLTGATEEIKCEIIRHKRVAPALINIALSNVLENFETSALPATTRLSLKIWIDGRKEPISLEDVFAGNSGPYDFMMAFPVNALASNPFSTVKFSKVEADLEITHERRTADIEAVWLDLNEVRAGEKVSVTVVLRPFGRETERISYPVTIPSNLPGETYDLEIGAGNQIEPDASSPKNVEDIIRLLEARYRSTDLVTVMELGTIGTRQEGKALRKLPFSVFGTLLASSAAGVTVAPDTMRVVTPTKYVLNGRKSLKIKVTDKGGD